MGNCCCGSKLKRAELGEDFSLVGRWKGKVVDVHDGDSVRVVFQRGRELIQVQIRLSGIDAPELSRYPPELSREEKEFEREQADLSKMYLEHLIGDGMVDVEIHGNDKFGGRYVGTLWKKGMSLNQQMLDHHYALPFNGKKKKETRPGFILHSQRNRI